MDFSQLIIPLSDDFSKYNDTVGLWESRPSSYHEVANDPVNSFIT